MEMTYQKAYELIDIEQQCVQRNIDCKCDRKCENCDLLQKDSDIIEMYELTKIALKEIIKKEKKEEFGKKATEMIKEIFSDAVTSV